MKTCNKNGVQELRSKRIGESCTLNNNCIYPNCLSVSNSFAENYNTEYVTLTAEDLALIYGIDTLPIEDTDCLVKVKYLNAENVIYKYGHLMPQKQLKQLIKLCKKLKK